MNKMNAIERVEKEKLGPALLMLSPTDYCNLSCKTCWRLRKNSTFSQPSFEFLKKIIEEAKELKVNTIDLTGGGEPFLRKDILKIMKIVKSEGISGTITTNATLIDQKKVEEIVKMDWDEIKISLDGSTPNLNNYIRGKGVFEKAIEMIKMLEKEKKKKHSVFPNIRLCFTITQKNAFDIPNFIKLASKLNIKEITFSPLFRWKTNREFWIRNEREIIKYMKEGLAISEKLKVKTNLLPMIKSFINHKLPKFCFAPWYMLFINANREAMVCCTLASLYQNRLGKVESLKKVWFGEKMKKIRERMKKRKFFKECRNCLPDFIYLFNKMYGEKKWSLKK